MVLDVAIGRFSLFVGLIGEAKVKKVVAGMMVGCGGGSVLRLIGEVAISLVFLVFGC